MSVSLVELVNVVEPEATTERYDPQATCPAATVRLAWEVTAKEKS